MLYVQTINKKRQINNIFKIQYIVKIIKNINKIHSFFKIKFKSKIKINNKNILFSCTHVNQLIKEFINFMNGQLPMYKVLSNTLLLWIKIEKFPKVNINLLYKALS